MVVKDQQLVQMQNQVTEYADSMKQKDTIIENLKQKLRDQTNMVNQVQTLSSMDIFTDQLRMTMKDSEMKLKKEDIEQRRKTNHLEHECVGERMIADQLRRDKHMILDNEASISAIMENFKEENTELAEVNYKLCLRVYGSLRSCMQGRWDDPPNSLNKQVIEDLREELSRLQLELYIRRMVRSSRRLHRWT